MLPQALSAVEETGLRAFVARAAADQMNDLEVAPLAAKLLSALVDDQRHQRLFDEALVGMHRLLNDKTTREVIREKMRRELPTLFNLFRADAYLVRRFVSLVSASVEEAKADANHPLRVEFDRFARDFIEKLGSSPEYAAKAEALKREFLGRAEVKSFAEDLWLSVAAFLQDEAKDEEFDPGGAAQAAFSPTSAAGSPGSRSCAPTSISAPCRSCKPSFKPAGEKSPSSLPTRSDRGTSIR